MRHGTVLHDILHQRDAFRVERPKGHRKGWFDESIATLVVSLLILALSGLSFAAAELATPATPVGPALEKKAGTTKADTKKAYTKEQKVKAKGLAKTEENKAEEKKGEAEGRVK